MRPVEPSTSANSSDDEESCEYSQDSFEEDSEDDNDSSAASLLDPPASCADKGPWKTISYDTDVEICERIGGGGMALVFRGRYKGNDVALKTLFDPSATPELRQSFMDELLVMSRMEHKNIVRFIGASTKPPRLSFAMELCKCSLHDSLYRRPERTMTAVDRIRICLEIVEGMEYMHTLSPPVIHRDLKTHNILIANDGTVKLCDFGLVRIRCASAGTPNYMAPELFVGDTYTKAVDVYAYALVMWEVFSCNVPFFGCDVRDIRLRVCRGSRPPMPTDAPKACQTVIQQCWDSDPLRRPNFSFVVDVLTPLLCARREENACGSVGGLDGDALDKMMKEMLI